MFYPNTSQVAHITRFSSSVRNLLTTMSQLPTSSRVITVRESPKDHKPRYHDAALENRAVPPLQKGQVLVKIGAAAFNHRDVGTVALADVVSPVYICEPVGLGLDPQGHVSWHYLWRGLRRGRCRCAYQTPRPCLVSLSPGNQELSSPRRTRTTLFSINVSSSYPCADGRVTPKHLSRREFVSAYTELEHGNTNLPPRTANLPS